jgi:hypothetical protein
MIIMLIVINLLQIYVVDKGKMVLTRQEKEKLILDLYNQGKTYKQIAQTARVSPRDIKPVLEKAEKEREKELGINTHEGGNGSTGNQNQTQKKTSNFSQAYRLYSEGKTPLDVAIELNLKEPEATRYYRQYWKLRQLHSLYLIHEEFGDGIVHIVKHYKKMKAAGIGVEQAIHFTKIASNDLPALEQKCQKLKKEVNSLESRKFEKHRTLNGLQEQINGLEKMLKFLETSCEEEEAKIEQIESEEIRLKRVVRRFKDDNRPGRKQQQFRYKPFNKLLPIAISDNQAIHVRGVERIFVKTEF